jgi:hypothetical protein
MGGRVDEVNASFVLNDVVVGRKMADVMAQVLKRYFMLVESLLK